MSLSTCTRQKHLSFLHSIVLAATAAPGAIPVQQTQSFIFRNYWKLSRGREENGITYEAPGISLILWVPGTMQSKYNSVQEQVREQ